MGSGRLLVVLCAMVLPGQEAALAHGDLHERIEKVTGEIVGSPNDASLLAKRAELYRQHQEFKEALEDIQRVRQLRSNVQDCFAEALILIESGNAGEAKTRLDEVLVKDPAHSRAMVARAKANVLLKNDAAAAIDYSAAATLLQKADPDFVLEHARCLVRLDQGAEALVVLDNAMRELGPLPSLQIPALEVEVALGRFESALTRLASLDRDGQMRFDLMQLRGEILLKARRFAEARETFEFIVSGIECQRAPLNPRIEGIIEVVRAHLQELYALNDR